MNDVALAARRSGDRYDVATRVSGAYGVDLVADGPGSDATVTLLFAELTDRMFDWTVRGGRQSGNLGGLIGTFDGLYAGYQVAPKLRLNTHLGYPVDSSRSAPSGERSFYALSADVGTFAEAWDISVYAIDQTYSGLTDRQAVGSELRYFRPGMTFVGLVDYDLHFGDLNDALLLATAALPANWTVAVNYDRRNSPGPELAQCTDRPVGPIVRPAVRAVLRGRHRAPGSRPHGAVRRLHLVAVTAVQRALAMVDGHVQSQHQRDAGLGRGRGNAGHRDGPDLLEPGARLRAVRSRRRLVAWVPVPDRRRH